MGIITDPIADMLTRIRNANQRLKKQVAIPYSTKKEAITKILKNEGFITDYKIDGEKIAKRILILLKYKGKEKAIVGLKRVSRPSMRVYAKTKEIPNVLSGYGVSIVSTSKGMMTGKEAKKANLGGEIIAHIW